MGVRLRTGRWRCRNLRLVEDRAQRIPTGHLGDEKAGARHMGSAAAQTVDAGVVSTYSQERF
jgi:hypothetical protein